MDLKKEVGEDRYENTENAQISSENNIILLSLYPEKYKNYV